MITMIQSTADK